MPKFKKKPVEIEAWQFTGDCHARGVCVCWQGKSKPHLHTMHKDQIVMLEGGDWIIPEPDGVHYYPCKPYVFENTYDPI